jgi:hypothetical protein
MKLLRQAVSNHKCGLRWSHAVRAAVLDRQISKLKRRAALV